MPRINTDLLRSNTNPLVLIIHPDINTLDEEKKWLQTRFNWPGISIGKDLSRDMLSGKVQGSTAMQAWLDDHVRGAGLGPMLLSEIDLLFEPSLSLDPLKLFQQASRFTRLIVLWPGIYSIEKVLSYAVPEHAHYRTWRNPDAYVLAL